MREKLLYTYALARSLHDEKEDILDIFVPFVLNIFTRSDKDYLTKLEIQQELKEFFFLEIPGHTLGSIITRAKRKGFLIQDHGRLYLSESGGRAQEVITDKRDIERRNNYFIDKLYGYLINKGVKIVKKEAARKLMGVINSNLYSLVTYLGEEPQKTNCNNNLDRLKGREILNFFKKIEQSDSTLFNILKDMIMGSIICAMVKKDQNQLKTKMKPGIIFLDTNVVFSLLGYHHPEISLPVQELIKLLEHHKYRLYVFSFTLEEISRVLTNYKDNYKKYSSMIKVNSVYNRLKYLGKTPSQITEIIARLEENLLELGVSVYPFDTDGFLIEDQNMSNLKLYKRNSTDLSLKHDLYAIEAVKRIRGRKVRRLEKAGAIFLTSDNKLTQYNFEKNHHKADSTINEVILDKLMTNLLWFKNPYSNSNLPLYSVLSMHSKDLFIDDKIWKKFYNVLTKMKMEDKLTDDDFSIMLYNDRIEEILLNFDGEVDDIDEVFIEEIVEESRNFYEEREVAFKLQQNENESLLEGNQQALETICNIKKNIYIESRKSAGRAYKSIQYLLIPGFILGFSLWSWQQPWHGLISFAVPIIGLFVDFGLLPKLDLEITLNRYFFKRANEKFLQDNDLERLSEQLRRLAASSKENMGE